ncbi:MAG: farnesyl diphosphate synthase [Candidatus Sericytochromatia bacterium]|nr:farnesyl diphosphate synthase [Candidatus Sericytochromatia bacterium]
MNPAPAFDLETYWDGWRGRLEQALDRLTPVSEPALLWEAMRYSLLAGGKRLRPMLTLATLEALGRDAAPAVPAACALELIHTQSLVHDDLPAMDDDALRRGKPTNHVVYGEGNAILAGDGLLAWAFAVLAQAGRAYPPAAVLAAQAELAEATLGMIGGQVVDLASEGQAVTPETLAFIHHHKTGCLIRAAVRIGALLGEATPVARVELDRYAEALGLAFQIADDILDCTRSAEELGKTPGKDAAAGKATYVAQYGLEAARERLTAEVEAAGAALANWGPGADPLRALARHVAAQVG